MQFLQLLMISWPAERLGWGTMGIKVILVVGFGGSGRKETLVLGIEVIRVGGFRCQQKETGPRHQSDPRGRLQVPAEGDWSAASK